MIYPVIDIEATGQNIRRLREQKGISVRELSQFLGLADVQAVYKWQRGEALPSTDNLVALSKFLDTPMDQILILRQESQSFKKRGLFLFSRLPRAVVFIHAYSSLTQTANHSAGLVLQKENKFHMLHSFFSRSAFIPHFRFSAF